MIRFMHDTMCNYVLLQVDTCMSSFKSLIPDSSSENIAIESRSTILSFLTTHQFASGDAPDTRLRMLLLPSSMLAHILIDLRHS